MVEKNPTIVMRMVKNKESALWRWIAESDMRRERKGSFMEVCYVSDLHAETTKITHMCLTE